MRQFVQLALHPKENGYTLIGVVLLLAVLSIWLSVAVPKTIQDIQRDKELECIHRGEQYARAIRLFYRKTGNYPVDITQLENTNNIRFLRKRYLDPITGNHWRLVYQGEVKPEIASQFGQFFGGATGAATPKAAPPGTIMGLVAGVPTTSFGYGGNGGITKFIDPSSGQIQNAQGSADPSVVPSPALATGAAISQPGHRSIVGVSSVSTARSIRFYKKQKYYNDWQFVYNPAVDGIGGGGQPGVNGPTLSGAPGVPPPALSATQ